MILQSERRFTMFKDSITLICEEIESGSTLSEGFAAAPMPFSSKALVTILEIGLVSGGLEKALEKVIDSDIEF